MSLFKTFAQEEQQKQMEDGFTNEALDYFQLFEKKVIISKIPELKPNQDLTYFCKGLNTHEVLVKLLEAAGPADVVIANYSLTELPLRILAALKDNNTIRSLRMLLDKTVYRTQNLRQFATELSDDIAFIEIHAKIILIKSDTKHFVYVSSSNLTKNHRFETGTIADNKSKYMFFESKITELIDENRS